MLRDRDPELVLPVLRVTRDPCPRRLPVRGKIPLIDFGSKKVKDEEHLPAGLDQLPQHLIPVLRIPSHEAEDLGEKYLAGDLPWRSALRGGAPPERILLVFGAGPHRELPLFRIHQDLHVIHLREFFDTGGIHIDLAIRKSQGRFIGVGEEFASYHLESVEAEIVILYDLHFHLISLFRHRPSPLHPSIPSAR